MKPIHEILDFKAQEYEKLIFQTYFNWAVLYCNRDACMLQQIIISRAINNWFNTEITKLYKEFRDLVKPYHNLPSKDKRQLFVNTITRIYEIYPKSILQQYKPRKIITTFNNN